LGNQPKIVDDSSNYGHNPVKVFPDEMHWLIEEWESHNLIAKEGPELKQLEKIPLILSLDIYDPVRPLKNTGPPKPFNRSALRQMGK
jgi:hypothetical protein